MKVLGQPILIMKVLGQPIFFIIWKFSLLIIEWYKCIEVYANVT